MNSSHTQSVGPTAAKSTANSDHLFTASSQLALDLDRATVIPGSLNDSHIIRGILVDSIRRSGKSREAIAEEMSYLVGREITPRQLNGFTAESKEDYKFPAELERAFCRVTGDDRLLSCRLEQAGLHVITEGEKLLLDLGRQYLKRNRAAEQIALLERRLHGSAA